MTTRRRKHRAHVHVHAEHEIASLETELATLEAVEAGRRPRRDRSATRSDCRGACDGRGGGIMMSRSEREARALNRCLRGLTAATEIVGVFGAGAYEGRSFYRVHLRIGKRWHNVECDVLRGSANPWKVNPTATLFHGALRDLAGFDVHPERAALVRLHARARESGAREPTVSAALDQEPEPAALRQRARGLGTRDWPVSSWRPTKRLHVCMCGYPVARGARGQHAASSGARLGWAKKSHSVT